ncbi:hypothetical protein FOA52_005050 [Chlamydomonas sp. UWO 241]|nr:hypothetical protein FOA52_005050 [Chlamydomonas sp. UWO 241]
MDLRQEQAQRTSREDGPASQIHQEPICDPGAAASSAPSSSGAQPAAAAAAATPLRPAFTGMSDFEAPLDLAATAMTSLTLRTTPSLVRASAPSARQTWVCSGPQSALTLRGNVLIDSAPDGAMALTMAVWSAATVLAGLNARDSGSDMLCWQADEDEDPACALLADASGLNLAKLSPWWTDKPSGGGAGGRGDAVPCANAKVSKTQAAKAIAKALPERMPSTMEGMRTLAMGCMKVKVLDRVFHVLSPHLLQSDIPPRMVSVQGKKASFDMVKAALIAVGCPGGDGAPVVSALPRLPHG